MRRASARLRPPILNPATPPLSQMATHPVWPRMNSMRTLTQVISVAALLLASWSGVVQAQDARARADKHAVPADVRTRVVAKLQGK